MCVVCNVHGRPPHECEYVMCVGVANCTYVCMCVLVRTYANHDFQEHMRVQNPTPTMHATNMYTFQVMVV